MQLPHPIPLILLLCLAGSLAPSGAWAAPASPGAAAPYAPPAVILMTQDGKDKAGTKLNVSWSRARPGPLPGGEALVGYQVLVAESQPVPLTARLGALLGRPVAQRWKEFEPKPPASPKKPRASLGELNPFRSYRTKVVALYASPDHPWYDPGAGKPVQAKPLTSAPVSYATPAKCTAVSLSWNAWTPPENAPTALVGFRVLVAEAGKPFTVKARPEAEEDAAVVSGLKPGVAYQFKVTALYVPAKAKGNWYAPGEEVPVAAKGAASAESEVLRPRALWYDPQKSNVLVCVLLYGVIVVLCFSYARRGTMYIRPIAGLRAVDDAIGRATEMGKPLLFVSGLGGIDRVGTIAAMLVLGHLARRTAPYETPLLVPCRNPLVMAAEREIVREALLEAGRPQAYRPDNIFFVTDSQFGYVAAVDGIMLRERPAANFYMGSFYAEALILAETGNATGAIQIAGTDSDTQIPFFITACDYTLMGEELYAAGAYLSRHPTLLAQLKGQDLGKALIVALLVGMTLMVTMQIFGHNEWVKWTLSHWLPHLFGS